MCRYIGYGFVLEFALPSRTESRGDTVLRTLTAPILSHLNTSIVREVLEGHQRPLLSVTLKTKIFHAAC